MLSSLPQLSHRGKLTASFAPSTSDVVLPTMFSGSSLPWPSISSQRDGKGRRVYQVPYIHIAHPTPKKPHGQEVCLSKISSLG